MAYLKSMRALVVGLGVGTGNMEEGAFRCDANVSIRPEGSTVFGIRSELKNLNSFRYVQKAIEYEIARQSDVVNEGGKVVQETRLYDSVRNVTVAMRSKENAQDYRYFPDPDLPPVRITEQELAEWKAALPELPADRLTRYVGDWGIMETEAALLAENPALSVLVESAVRIYAQPRKIVNIILGSLLR